jgi:hypothetical protein
MLEFSNKSRGNGVDTVVYQVRWLWIIYPAVLIGAGYVFLAMAAYETRRTKTGRSPFVLINRTDDVSSLEGQLACCAQNW